MTVWLPYNINTDFCAQRHGVHTSDKVNTTDSHLKSNERNVNLNQLGFTDSSVL